MLLAGRRGEIRWNKQKFIGGGGRLDYDSYEALGLVVPLLLLRPLHTFGWGQDSEYASAIPLRPSGLFAMEAIAQDWCGPLCILSAILILPLCCSGYSTVLTILTILLFASSGLVLLFMMFTGARHKHIRLVLGKHYWGSSDPATWSDDLCDRIVDPREAFGVKSFAALAEQYLEEGQWRHAMWAARLCAAVEDEATGEALTSEILNEPAVGKKLARVQSDPRKSNAAFGEPPALRDFVSGDLDEPIIEISSRRFG